MPARKLSELPAASTLNAADLVPLVQGGETRRTTVGDLRAGLLPTTGGTLGSPLAVPAGSTAAPSLTFSGDTDTGLCSTGPNQMALAAGGVGKLFVNGTAIAVGRDASAALAAAVPAQAQIMVGGTNPANTANDEPASLVISPYYKGRDRGFGYVSARVYAETGGGNDRGALVLGAGGTVGGVPTLSKAVVVQDTGNVGVGTGTASPAYRLTVAGVVAPASDATHALGAPAARWSDIYVANAMIQTSDERDKRDLEPCPLGLDFVLALRPIAFRMRDEVRPAVTRTRRIRRPRTETVMVERAEVREEDGLFRLVTVAEPVERPVTEDVPLHDAEGRPLLDEAGQPVMHAVPVEEEVEVTETLEPAVERRHKRRHTGLSAQDVKRVLDEFGVDMGCFIHDTASDRMGLRYGELVAPLIRAVQELAGRVAALEAARAAA